MLKARDSDMVPMPGPVSPFPVRPWVEAERLRGWAWRVMVVQPIGQLLGALWRAVVRRGQQSERRLSPYAVMAGLIGVVLIAAAAVSGADTRAACAAADVAAQEKLRPLLRRGEDGAAWLVANIVASSRVARGYCSGDRPERGLAIYRRIIDTLDSYGPSVETALQFQGDKGD